MPTLKISDDTLLMTASKEIMILPFNRSDQSNIRVAVPPPIPTSEISNKNHQNGNEDGNVTCASFSKCYEYFAACDDKKNVTVWKSKKWKQFYKQWSLPTRANAICFSNDSHRLLIADKSGDVLSFDLEPPSETYTCLLGHLSMLMDVAMSSCGKYIITSDRDEKIRVSKYPNAYNIQCYCLGHTDFVTNIQVLPNYQENILLSSSGDGSIRIWKYLEGVEVGRREVSQDIESNCDKDNYGSKVDGDIDGETETSDEILTRPVASAVRQIRCKPISKCSATVATIIDRFNGIVLYKLDSDYTFTLLSTIHSEAAVWDIQFSTSSYDLIALMNKTSHLQIFSAESLYSKNTTIFSRESKDFFIDKEDSIGSMEQLYKKLFDNVEQYTIRKENRLQQQSRPENGGENKDTADSEDIKRLKLDQNT